LDCTILELELHILLRELHRIGLTAQLEYALQTVVQGVVRTLFCFGVTGADTAVTG